MKAVLDSETARFARGEIPDPPELEEEVEADDEQEEVEEVEPAPADEEQEEGGEDDQEVAEEEGGVVEDEAAEDEGEADVEPSAEEQGEDFYLGRFRTREEAERGWETTLRYGETNAKRAAEAEKEREELRQRLAYYEGLAAGRGSGQGQDFDQWADGRIEANAEHGMLEAIQFSRETGDQSYAYAYTDRWADADPYQASIWRNRLENAIFATQQPVTEETFQDVGADAGTDIEVAQEVINSTWTGLRDEYPDMYEDDTARGMAEVIRNDPTLRRAALTADPVQVRDAFISARRQVRSSQNGPRRVRKSDADQLAAEKRAATVSTGDGAPQRRPSNPGLTAEEESILAGAEKLGLKRRDE